MKINVFNLSLPISIITPPKLLLRHGICINASDMSDRMKKKIIIWMLILIINNDSTHTRTYNEWKLLFINISCKVHRWYPSSIVWEKQKIVILINLWTKERKIFIVKTFIPLSHVCKQMIKIHCQQVFFSVFLCVCVWNINSHVSSFFQENFRKFNELYGNSVHRYHHHHHY